MANKTIEQIKAEAATVRDATVEKENTAMRVGTVLIDMIDTLSESVSINAIKGFVVIDSTSELPENPTPEQQQKGYLLDTTLYVYVGEGGDTLDGKYQSAELKGADGAPGAPGPKGDSGVHLGDVVLVNDLETGGEESALSAEMGKELGDVLVNDTKDLTSQMKAGYVMSGTANVGQTITLTETANANGHYIVLDVVEGEVVYLKGKGYSGNRQYVFMDANNVVKEIAAWNKAEDTTWTAYTTPAGATKLVVNSISATNYGVKVPNNPMTARVSALEAKAAEITTPEQPTDKYYASDMTANKVAQGNVGSTVTIATNNGKRYIKIACAKGDKFHYITAPNGTNTYVLTDENDIILSKGGTPYTTVDTTIEITNGKAAYIYFNDALGSVFIQKIVHKTQGEFNNDVYNVTKILETQNAENLWDGGFTKEVVGTLNVMWWTSLIPVESGEGYTCKFAFYTNKHIAYYDGDTLISTAALTASDNVPFHVSIPADCDGIKISNINISQTPNFYVVKGNVDDAVMLQKKLKGYVDEYEFNQAVNKKPLSDKNIAILGDSITNVGYYPTEFFRICGYKNKAVYGRDGAAWTNDEYHTDNNIKERIDALENGITWTPDIIIVALGRNDNGRSPIGDVCDALWADQTTLDERATMYNAIRYGVKRLRSLYPNAKIFLQGIQWAKIRVGVIDTVAKYKVQDDYVLQYNEVIRNAADHMGCSFINVFADGVCEDTADRYLSDGLHDNAAGGVVHGRCVAAAVLAAYKD